MTAQAAGALLRTVVNNSGVIEARTLDQRAGQILLLGDMHSGTVNVAGTLDASAPNGGNGGFIETSAASVRIVDAAGITTTAAPSGTTGMWLIDPTDFIIGVGGDISGSESRPAWCGPTSRSARSLPRVTGLAATATSSSMTRSHGRRPAIRRR